MKVQDVHERNASTVQQSVERLQKNGKKLLVYKKKTVVGNVPIWDIFYCLGQF